MAVPIGVGPGGHPRVRGGNKARGTEVAEGAGPSPRTRGKLLGRERQLVFRGAIPAYAGETPCEPSSPPPAGGHPRVRGGNRARRGRGRCRGGPSPRTRGKHRRTVDHAELEGAIPAYAGETVSSKRSARFGAGHPRVRGGNLIGMGGIPDQYGPSPRTRGKLVMQVGGNYRGGPSPRTRGKQALVAQIDARRGAIPAYAGETRSPAHRCPPRRGHPRVRGGNSSPCPFAPAMPGPSPRTRGKRELPELKRRIIGAIPAYAGETRSGSGKAAHLRGHPRVRGGNASSALRTAVAKGPSPRTRGKPALHQCTRARRGAIPAYAGETRSGSGKAAHLRGHPRVRGGNTGYSLTWMA